jgi:putative oxidoreductase
MSFSSLYHKLDRGITTAAGYAQSPALLLMRLAWGFQLYESGRGHLANVPEMVKRFEGWGIPYPTPNAYISATTEVVGGVLLMLGLFSRWISIPLFFNFCVAYLTAGSDSVKALLHLQSPDDFINDAAFPFLVTSLVIFAFGPGKISLDALFFRKSAAS